MTLNEEQALEQLESFTIPEKKAALQSLVNLGKALQYSDEVAKLLDDEDAPVRKEAALTLGICKPSPGKEAQQIARTLADSLMDDDKTVRAEVARAIAQLGKDGATVADRLEKILGKEKDDEPAMAAIECLSAIGEVTRLSAFIGHSSPNVVRVALVEAGRSPEAARAKFAPLIRDRLGHQDTSVRLAAAQASGELGSVCNDDHLQALADLAADRQVKVRRAAVQALGKVGVRGVPHLVRFFGDADEGVRHFAAETLSGVGGEEAAAASAELAEHPNAPVRRAALSALGRMKADGRGHSGLIAKHLNDDDFEARLASIQALNELGACEEAASVGALRNDDNKGIRQAAVAALAKFGKDGGDEALAFLDDPEQAVRQAAVKVFSPLHSKLAADLALPHAPAVARKLSDEDWRVRFAAVVALGDLHTAQYANQVAVMCNDDNNQVRRSAVTSLTKLGATAAHVAAFLQDEDAGVRKEAETAYAELKANGPPDDGEFSECD
mmetsp:Transcript_115097/g.358435  ORF Transcript_115097/g.358435 Transcript_115097/m.358435 type:complete len:498 (+) Transcript_115097:91-1584(+)